MILVTGATGTVGRVVVRLLSAAGERVRALTRDAARVPELPGVAGVVGDFGDPDSLARAAEGATAVFLCTAPGPRVPEQDAAVLDAARAAGVARVVKLSAIGTGERGGPGDWHAPGEAAVRSCGARWTLLRPSSFASNTLGWAAAIAAGDPVRNPSGDGVQGVVDPRDVAELAVRALTSDGLHARVLTPTGPELLSVDRMAVQLGAALGRPVKTLALTPEAYRQGLLDAGLAPEFAEVAAAGARLVAEGGNARLTDDVATVLGRPPRSYATWAHDHRDAFAR
ncbi:NAD(P)H-binding protein [Streptomyces sp. NPDC050560]|uniref:NAD(P)H-binding protein n=1 Tax=Streptomyces sp. NPDC050560 TaxID=3365630 RepID=UPI00379C6C74